MGLFRSKRVGLSAAERGRGSSQKRERSERFCGVAASPLSYQDKHTPKSHKGLFTHTLSGIKNKVNFQL